MEYYILKNNLKEGPYSIEDLKTKNITANTMIWKVGLSDWVPANQVGELSELLSNLPPEAPTSQQVPPKTWLVESILVTCLCCLPFGVVGIINATKVESLYHNKQYDLALQHSKQAKKWTLWGFFIMLVIWILYILGMVIFTLITLYA